MKELTVNMWDISADAYCITTNGIIKANGCAVMGAGVALSAVRKFPGCDKYLGIRIKKMGHNVGVFYTADLTDLISFPTKYHWKDPSDIKLIEKSAKELIDLININKYNKVILPRPGCSNGGLDWKDVKKVIEPILDDRVVVVSL
jgi:hypothetical protein